MKFFFAALIATTTLFAAVPPNKAEYPQGPVPRITPGSLCDRPDEYRYAERIPYCNRGVDSRLKEDVFREYRLEGFTLPPRNRSQYKIDHLIPLCAGGSNNENNLWPQHSTVFKRTDPLEAIGCVKLKAGKIKQAALVKLLLDAKHDLSLVTKTLRTLQNL
jgi:hypothetical protein